MIRYQFLSIFLAWFLKLTILRLGGIRLYRRTWPFFIGLIVGFFLGMGGSILVDVIWFPGAGHPILNG
jgi:hypothetical protein